jgi:hypothetical protein
MHEYNMDESKLENYRTESEAYKEVINTISKEYVKQNPSAFYIWDNIAK